MLKRIISVITLSTFLFTSMPTTYSFAATNEEHVAQPVTSAPVIEEAKEVRGNPYVMSLPDGEGEASTSSVPMLRAPKLPATYLPGDPTAVKDQGTEGLCWAYSATKSMELSTYLAENHTNVLSPLQFAQTFYKTSAVDQFRLTSGDRVINSSTGNGGNDLVSIFASMTQSTPTTSDTGTYANVVQHPIQGLFCGVTNINDIKEMIYQYGACTIAVKARDNNGCWYETSSEFLNYDHEITLIGWQDAVSKSNFTNTSGEHPNENGAFRFVNSWGTDSFGDQGGKGGYGWLSYEDVTFTDESNNRVLAYKMTTDWDVDNVYQNDGCYSYTTRITTRAAEVFTTQGGTSYEKVQGAIIGLHSAGEYTAYVYRIQDYNSALTDQVLLGSEDFTIPAQHYGYTTVYFSKDIVLTAGDTFAVAVTRKDGSQFKVLVDNASNYNFARFQPSSPQNSYYFDDTKYSNTDNTAPRIKALTKNLTSTDHTGTIDDYRISLDYARLMYTGEPQYPTITIQDEEGNLCDNSQFRFTYNNNINASRYAEVVISSTNPRVLGTKRLNFTIQPRPLDDAVTEREFTAITNVTYRTFLSSLYLAYNRKALLYQTDYTVSNPNTLIGYGDNSITLYGKGNFTSSVSITVQGTQNGVAVDQLRVSTLPNKIYTGKPIKLESSDIRIRYGTTDLVYGSDYRLTYENNINVGDAIVTFVGLGSYTGCTGPIGTFKIKPLNVNDCIIQLQSEVAYMNQPVTLVPGKTITVFNSDASCVIPSSNYTLDYTNNIGIGTAIVYVRGRTNLTGAVPYDITITQARMESANIQVKNVAYTGSEVYPEVTVTLDGVKLRENSDYTLRYTDNLNPGTGRVTVLGKDYIQGYKEAVFQITPPSLSKASVSGVESSYIATGTNIEPKPTVTIGTKTLELGKDYKLTYENNIDVDIAYIHIIGLYPYTGETTIQFNILEDPTPKFTEYSSTLTSVSQNVFIQSKLEYDVPFEVESVRTTNKKIATIKTSGKITVKKKTGKVTLEVHGIDDKDVRAFTLTVVKPKFKRKKYTVNVGDTIKLDDIIDLYNITPSKYKIKSKYAEVDEKNRTITFTRKGTATLKLYYDGCSYKPKVTFKIKNGTVSSNGGK